ncbi:glycerate kinase family protein [Actinoplanes teichomyceticus]|uniref:Glycerate kinase n=1 Tax=Actinoplanes teichomyceticus TaxID=1867 RepID=A0A561WIR7_ACTTI|nr:glycerate kinase [Actinoplanes teichomyceticus]TWG23756.1 glycerate kinase [Actinoplanes teichomyceticus]GIF11800.1 glycerate kinase [Actinoplanes teichomyceticus]
MRVLICPDKFAGTLSAPEVAQAVADGWSVASDELVRRPIADGGPGFVEVLATALDGRRIPVRTVDPLGRPAQGEILYAGGVAYVESAQACGLHLLTPAERDPNITTSYGLGLLLAAAVETGAGQVVIGLGGSAVNDAGAGMLAALGAGPVDVAGYALPYGGAPLITAETLAGVPQLRQVALVAATDVDNPLTGLHGASNVFGPQKGAGRDDVLRLDAALEHFAGVLEKAFGVDGLAARPGAGAAGGLGAALIALGARVTSGIGLVSDLIGLNRELDAADLVITGEGSFDHQSLRGKVVAGIAAGARDRGLPCVVLAGRNETGHREASAAGVTETHTLVEHFGSVETALTEPARGLRELAARLSRQWSRG